MPRKKRRTIPKFLNNKPISNETYSRKDSVELAKQGMEFENYLKGQIKSFDPLEGLQIPEVLLNARAWWTEAKK